MREATNRDTQEEQRDKWHRVKAFSMKKQRLSGASSMPLRSDPETQFVIKEGRFPDYTCIPMSFRDLDIVIIIG